MGFNATVMVLVDQLDEIARNPHFGKQLAAAITYRLTHPDPDVMRDPWVTGARVASVAHADDMQIVAVGGNTSRVLSVEPTGTTDEALLVGALLSIQRRKRRVPGQLIPVIARHPAMQIAALDGATRRVLSTGIVGETDEELLTYALWTLQLRKGTT